MSRESNEDRKKRIIDAAIDVFIANGVYKTSLVEICNKTALKNNQIGRVILPAMIVL